MATPNYHRIFGSFPAKTSNLETTFYDRIGLMNFIVNLALKMFFKLGLRFDDFFSKFISS